MRLLIRVIPIIILCSLLLLTLSCNERKPTQSEPAQPLQQLTFSGAWDPTVSADGKWLAYTVAGSGIIKQDLTSGQIYILTSFGSEPDWSHTSNLILFRTTEPVQSRTVLATVNTLNGDTAIIRYEGFDDGAVWSPVGTEIAAQDSHGIRIITYPSGDTSYVTCSDPVDGSCEGENPTWAPDADWIAFEDGLEIMKIARNGGTAVQVVGGLNDVTEPAWSPDGKWLAFAMQDSTTADWHIWVSDARGQDYGLYRVTATDSTCTGAECRDGSPCWSPDSKIIYFNSNRTGRYEIWSIGFRQ